MRTHTETPPGEPTIVMTRIYEAPRDLVWRLSTEPEHIRKWWGGPGVTSPVCELDLRPGGAWKHVMRFADGREIALDFVFEEVEPPARLVWRHADQNEGKDGGPWPHFTSTLEAMDEGRTRCTLVVRFDSVAERDAAVGFGFTRPIEQSNDRLAAYLRTNREEQPR